ncbi:MAG: cytochrome c oxidase assembly protein [Geminicoccaceae bacterium]
MRRDRLWRHAAAQRGCLRRQGAGAAGDGLFQRRHRRGLPWQFRPAQRSVTVPVGEQTLAFFEAVNRSDHPVVGRAVFNVTPFKVGSYFAKIQCFCFNEQTLKPSERVEMPVSFFVDPAMLDDPDSDDVTQVTLSYTFYLDKEATARPGRAQTAGRPADAAHNKTHRDGDVGEDNGQHSRDIRGGPAAWCRPCAPWAEPSLPPGRSDPWPGPRSLALLLTAAASCGCTGTASAPG